MHPKIFSHRGALCNTVRRIAQEAGALVLQYYDGLEDFDVASKADGSPVTQADREAEKLIAARLADIARDVPIIGEEAVAEGRGYDVSGQDYFWLVDPLDGTRDFVAGGVDFTVNIALIHQGNPVLGVIFAPEKGEMYMGYTNEDSTAKALRYFDVSKTEKEMRVRRPPAEGLTVLTSSHYHGGGKLDQFLEEYKVAKVIKRSSSLKICAIAAGKGDLYARFGPTGEWDTAAGDAILRAAGGVIKDFQTRQPLRYGANNDNFLNAAFVAASDDLF